VRVLVIDDSRTMRSILGNILKQAGFEVAEAANGREGLVQLERLGGADVALVDWNMPEMDGFEFVRAVRATSQHADMRLLMVTSETDLSRVARALEAGADEYIMKPFTREVILGKLEVLGISPC
jgi:two-component system chemotaxis response regulator CheY